MFKHSDEVFKEIKIIRNSKLFNEKWYKEKYHDVNLSKMDPIEHYVRYGSMLRRDPNPDFSTSFYMDTHPGVIKRNLNPLANHLYRKGVNGEMAPDYRYVLWAASRMAKESGYARALDMCDKYLPDNFQYTKSIIKGNLALEERSDSEWLEHINFYLAHFNLSPLKLKNEGTSLLSRMTTDDAPYKYDDQKISIIMPAWNAEKTVIYAAQSILNQTWHNIELIIIDDASEDSTWECLKQIKSIDSRVKIIRNKNNVGPYVSKNIGLQISTGDYITGQDADDWAVPQRLEKHMHAIRKSNNPCKASLGYMLRIRPDGFFSHIGKITRFSLDGACRKASISCMFERKTLVEKLGYWDTVKFGADSEMISRAMHFLGDEFAEFEQITMICLDLETSLTNHPLYGVDKTMGVSPIRAKYREEWEKWHKQLMTNDNGFLDFPQKNRRYMADKEMIVSEQAIIENIEK